MTKKSIRQKAFALSFILAALLLPTAGRAQSYNDATAESYNGGAFYELIAYDTYLDELANILRLSEFGNRDGGGISNQTFELEIGGPSTPTEAAPIGSGLLIHTAAGAGYAMVRRKRNSKHGSALLLAFALLLGMTNCKKTEETITPSAPNTVQITLDVENGSKVDINTGTGVVTFQTGDVIYVGNNGKYCGQLVHDGTKFAGNIAPTSTDDYLHFYFMGNQTPFDAQYDYATLEPNTTNTFLVFITDQTSGLPLISYAPSTIKYTPGTTEYTAMLRNYCSLVKFYTSVSIPTNCEIALSDNSYSIKNKVTVDFNANNAATATSGEPYSFEANNVGLSLYAETEHVRWAVFVEQPAIPEYTGAYKNVIPYAWYNGSYNGKLSLPAIEKNHIYTNEGSGYNLNLMKLVFVDGCGDVWYNDNETWWDAFYHPENSDLYLEEEGNVRVDGKWLYERFYDEVNALWTSWTLVPVSELIQHDYMYTVNPH